VIDFPTWRVVEFKITLGEIVTMMVGAGAVYYVGRIIERRNAGDRAKKDVIAELCRESRQMLHSLADSIASYSPKGGTVLDQPARNRVMRDLQVFCNSVYTIDIGIAECAFKSTYSFVADLKTAREDMRSQIAEPLVTAGFFDDAQLRQIEGTIRKTRELLIKLQIGVLASK
jgi:hypothetical protein